MAVEPERINPEEGVSRPNVAYEHTDVSASRIALLGAGVLLIGLLATVFAAAPFFGLKAHRAEVSPKRAPDAPRGVRLPSAPRLQALPQADLQTYNASYDRLLGSYSWVDRAKGVAAIPIDRAMRIASTRGIPRTPPDPAIQLSQPVQGTRLTGFQGKVVEPPR